MAKWRRARCFNYGFGYIGTRYDFTQSRYARIGMHPHDQAILSSIGCLYDFWQPQMNGFNMGNFHILPFLQYPPPIVQWAHLFWQKFAHIVREHPLQPRICIAGFAIL